MKTVCKTEQVIVFDNVLPKEHIEAIWNYFQYTPLQQVNTSLQAWTVTDGQPFMGNSVMAAKV